MHSFKKVFKRRKWYFIIPLCSIIIISIFIAFVIPPKYTSKATILIETQVVPEDLVRSTITGLIEARLHSLSQRVLSVPNLSKIIDQYGLYENIRANHTNQELVEKLRQSIELTPITTQWGKRSDQLATTAFEIGFTGRDPQTVAKVTSKLTSIFLEANVHDREAKAQTTVDFLTKQQQSLRMEIAEKEQAIAAFKNKHPSELPEMIQSNRNTMERLAQQIELKESELRRITDHKALLEGQLATIDPYIFDNASDTDVATLKRRYTALKATLSENHPDMLILKNKIAALEHDSTGYDNRPDLQAELQELQAQKVILEKQYSSLHPDLIALNKKIKTLKEQLALPQESVTPSQAPKLRPNNPVYLNTAHQIQKIAIDIRETKKDLRDLKKNYALYAKRVENTPRIEQEYKALMRGYANAQQQFETISARLMVAQQALMLEEDRMAEKMTIISPPFVPEKPSSPNRLAILFLGCALAFAGGLAMVAVAENLDHSVHDAHELAELAGQPVMAVIPVIATSREKMFRKMKMFAIPSGIILTVVAGLLVVHLFYRPLNVLWIQLSHKFNIMF
ncbi:GumC family protein [Desulfoplanes formicivorans]|nr:Wzz/FepE/Etk N-terminal domain-containing protein [Desulfoplanes formicivorans]